MDLGTDPGLEFVSNKLEVKVGDGIKKSSSGTEVDLGTDPGLEILLSKLKAKVHTALSTKLTMDGDGIGLDLDVRPTWTGIHRHIAYVKCEGQLLVSNAVSTAPDGSEEFPLQIRTVDDDGRMFYAGGDEFVHHYACMGGHDLHSRDYDLDFGDWS